MGEYTKQEWYIKEVEHYMAKYGEIPPHWVIFPDTHPYSIGWRMGAGETFVMVFGNWWEDNFESEEEKIQFFLKYPPPPRWLEVAASCIWDIEIEGEFEKSPYLDKLKQLGFTGTDEYVKDLEDPKWLD